VPGKALAAGGLLERPERVRSSYFQTRAVVTGGLGFIGSNLVIRLVELGARVTVVDAKVRGCGANEHNLHPVRGDVRLLIRDIADASEFGSVLASADVIFNLAGEVSHIHSMRFPERDAQLNAIAQLRFVQECARMAPGVRIVYAGTRQIYGVPRYLPVDEQHPVSPVDINGIHKYSAMMYHLLYARGGALESVVLRLTNVYGPRMALNEPCQGVLSTFVRRLLLGQPIEVFGDGKQLRDPLYVDDAVETFLLAGREPSPASSVYNVGGPAALELREIAQTACRAAGAPPPVCRPFPPERKPIDIGSYRTDSSRIARELGWRASTPFDTGIARTLEYYRAQLGHYLDAGSDGAQCRLLDQAAPERRVAAG
jgi:UDP-glucose 4-epimerase